MTLSPSRGPGEEAVDSVPGLNVYIAAVRLGPPSDLSPAEKAELTADAVRIKAVIGCQ